MNEIKEILSSLGLGFGMKFDAQGRLVSPAGAPAPVSPGGYEDLIEDEGDDLGEDEEAQISE